jgi:predicted DNA-binding transcriptional regulator AlpA
MSDPDQYAPIKKTCERFGFSRATFYRMLADEKSGLEEVIRRVPPLTGRIRVPQRAFENWLSRRNGCAPVSIIQKP